MKARPPETLDMGQMIHNSPEDCKKKIKVVNPYSREAFRIWLTQNFCKDQLGAAGLRAGTVKKIYFALCGSLSDKSRVIFNKNVETLARLSNLSKSSTLKALAFLEKHRFIDIETGRGRRASTYYNFLKETGIRVTKRLKRVPFMNIHDFVMMRDLGANRTIKRAEFSVLTQILIFSNYQSGLFMASKETIQGYSQLNRKTIDKAFKKLIERGILIPERELPPQDQLKIGLNMDNRYRRGNRVYIVNRDKIISMIKPKSFIEYPTRLNHKTQPDFLTGADVVAAIQEGIDKRTRPEAAEGPQTAAG